MSNSDQLMEAPTAPFFQGKGISYIVRCYYDTLEYFKNEQGFNRAIVAADFFPNAASHKSMCSRQHDLQQTHTDGLYSTLVGRQNDRGCCTLHDTP